MSTSSNASGSRPPVEGQLSTLPGTTTHLTGHNEEGKAIVYQSRPATWKAFDDKVRPSSPPPSPPLYPLPVHHHKSLALVPRTLNIS